MALIQVIRVEREVPVERLVELSSVVQEHTEVDCLILQEVHVPVQVETVGLPHPSTRFRTAGRSSAAYDPSCSRRLRGVRALRAAWRARCALHAANVLHV